MCLFVTTAINKMIFFNINVCADRLKEINYDRLNTSKEDFYFVKLQKKVVIQEVSFDIFQPVDPLFQL